MVHIPALRASSSLGGFISRRSLLAAGLAGLVVTGCSVENPISEDRTPRPSTKLGPDVAVATSALSEITAVRTAVTATMARFPATRSQLAPLVRLHQAHERTLANAVPDRVQTSASATPAPYVVSGPRDKALANLRAREHHLHGTLNGLALRAQSGEFARLLASMGAGVSQQLASAS